MTAGLRAYEDLGARPLDGDAAILRTACQVDFREVAVAYCDEPTAGRFRQAAAEGRRLLEAVGVEM